VTDCQEVPRPLSPVEQKVLSQYLAGSRRVDSETLIGQIPHTVVVRKHVSTLDLAVDETQAKPVHVEAPGPLRPRMFAIGPDGEVWGEVIVWVTRGFLSGMGLAWWNDDVPRSWDRVGATAYEWELPAGA
jgi:hypothetical protein